MPRIAPWIRAQLAVAVAILIAHLLIRSVNLPNPAAITLLGVVAAAFLDGIRGGVVGALFAFASALLWFYPFHTQELQLRTGTILVSGLCMAFLVGVLRRRSELLLRQSVEYEKERQHSVERERYVEQIRRSEERNRAFFELAGAGFAEVDAATGRFVRVNAALCTLLGYTEEELLQRTFLDVTYPQDRDRAASQYEAAKSANGSSYEADKRYLCRNGEVKWVHTSIRLVHDGDGRPLFSAGIIIDITARELAKNALLDANTKLRRLVDANIIGVIISRPDGTFIEVNDAYLNIIGYTREDLLADAVLWRDITPPEYLPHEERAIREAEERGVCEPYEKEYIRKDGSRVPILIGFAKLPGTEGEFIAFVLDLTQQKAAENRERQARAEAERANRAKDEFLAVVSHELRTPMTSILGWATVLHSTTTDDATRATGWRLLLEAANLEARLIDDLLDFSRAASGKLVLKTETLDLRQVVSSAIMQPLAVAQRNGVRVSLMLPDRQLLVNGDEQRLNQVVSNVVDNAIKFTPPGGDVCVSLSDGAEAAILRVRDSGRGIKPEFLPHVFDWFTQEDASSTREAGGLGLGLAIVRHIVGVHGGRVEAQSEGLGRGAEFVIRLPIARTSP